MIARTQEFPEEHYLDLGEIPAEEITETVQNGITVCDECERLKDKITLAIRQLKRADKCEVGNDYPTRYGWANGSVQMALRTLEGK